MFFGYVDFTDDVLPYYVGIGNQSRVAHLRRNTKHTGVAKHYGCVRVVLWQSSDWELTKQWKVTMIKHMETFHYDNPSGIGCNFTRGGQGTQGCILSLETRSKMRLAKLGKSKSLEHRAKIAAAVSAAARGKPHPHKPPSHETRAKMSAAVKATATRKKSMLFIR